MADEDAGTAGSDSEKRRFLEATFDDVRKSKAELEQRKEELQEKLDEIRDKETVAKVAEREIEAKLKDMLRVEAKFEEILSEEENLRRQEGFVKDDLLKVKRKLSKIKMLYEKINSDE